MIRADLRQEGQALLSAIFFSLVILMVGSVLAQVGVRTRMQYTYSKQAYLAEQVAEAAAERGSATALYAYSNAPAYPPPSPCTTPVAPYSITNPCLSPWGSANGGQAVTTYDYTDPNYSSGATARTAAITITDQSYNATTGTNKKPWIFKIEAIGKVPLAMTSAHYEQSGSQGYITRKVTRYIYVVEDLTFGLMSCGKIGFGSGCNGGGSAVVNGNVGWGVADATCVASVTSTHVPPPNKKRYPLCPPDVSASYLLDQNNFVGTDGKYTGLVVNFPDSGLAQELTNYQKFVDQRIMALITPYIDPTPATPAPTSGSTDYHYKASAMNNGQTPASGDTVIAGVQDFASGNTIKLKVTVPPGANGIALYRGTSSSNHTLVAQLAVPGGVSGTPKVVTVTDTGSSNNIGFDIADLPDDLRPEGLTDRVLLAALQAPGADARFDPWNTSVVALIRDLYYNSTVAYAAGVVVASFTPTTGTPGSTSVTITGSGFTGSQGSGSVKFNGTAATTYTSWGSTSITATVPAGATTGPITVTNNAGTSGTSSTNFCVASGSAPSITDVNPSSGTVGTVVTITGTNFGSSQGSSTIAFNGTAGVPTAWSDTSITVPVPSGATSGAVKVTANCQDSNTNFSFTLTSGPPTTNSPLNPTCGAAGSSTVINGTNFGSSGTVMFGTTTATTSSWGSTSITANVPSALAAGNYNVTVTVGSNTSNSQVFSVPSGSPSISVLTPNNGNIGDLVTITGTNFSAQHGTNTITFGGTSAAITSWSDTSVTTAVPTGLSPGAVSVIVNACSAATAPATYTVATPSATPTPAPSGTPTPAPSPAANNTPPSTNTSKEIAQASPLGNFLRDVTPYLATTNGGTVYPVVPVIVNIGGVNVTWNANGSFNFALVNVGKLTSSGSATQAKYWKGWDQGWPSNYNTSTTCPACMKFSTYTNSSNTDADTLVNGTPTLTSAQLGLSLLLNNISGNGNFTMGASGQSVLVYITHNFGLSGNWTLFGSLMVASKNGSDFIMTGNSNITYDSSFVSKVNNLLPGLLLPVQNLPMIVVRRALQSEWGNR